VEGLVADRNLTLGHLIGTIKTFFEKIGITQLRFKPAYNPYTEPSMEIFGYHPELKKWTEIGNSGRDCILVFAYLCVCMYMYVQYVCMHYVVVYVWLLS
jgi:hypothetical protein